MPAPQECWIARPGDLILPSHAVSQWATRVGGLPTYPEACPPPANELIACKVCGKQMALILQAHVPLSSEQVDEPQPNRFLYLFCCIAEGCGKQPGCWQALRVVAPDANTSTSSSGRGAAAPAAAAGAAPQQQSVPSGPAAAAGTPAPAERAPPSKGVQAAAADDWGMGGSDDWGDGADPGDTATAAFDFGDLNAALEAVGSTAAAAAAATAAAKQARSRAPGSSNRKAASVYNPARTSLPAFYLYSQPESHCSSGGTRQPQAATAEQEHLQQLVARYEQEEGAPVAASGTTGSAAAACTPAIEGGPESWGGEAYEEDTVLALPGGKRGHVGPAYFKFSKQLARCPDQCARYSFDGKPLWPTSQGPPEPQPCSTCGGPRVFELQLMTPVIPALAESAEWLAAGGTAGALPLLQPADSWEWLTVCVNSCRGSCCDGSGEVQLLREEVVLANEE